jgi:hypothetical protein
MYIGKKYERVGKKPNLQELKALVSDLKKKVFEIKGLSSECGLMRDWVGTLNPIDCMYIEPETQDNPMSIIKSAEACIFVKLPESDQIAEVKSG